MAKQPQGDGQLLKTFANNPCTSVDSAATPLQELAGEPLLRGLGATAVKSAALLFVSVQPLLARRSAKVVLGAGAGPLPSKQLAVEP